VDDEVFLFLFFLEEVFGNQLSCGVSSLPNPVGNTGDVIVILLRPSNSLLDEFNSVEEFVLERAWLADKKVVSLGLNEVGIDAEIVKAQVVILPGANEALNDLQVVQHFVPEHCLNFLVVLFLAKSLFDAVVSAHHDWHHHWDNLW